jgi:hypothetical protein
MLMVASAVFKATAELARTTASCAFVPSPLSIFSKILAEASTVSPPLMARGSSFSNPKPFGVKSSSPLLEIILKFPVSEISS